MSGRIPRLVPAVVSIALSFLPFLFLVQLCVDVVKVYSGLAAFAGLASLVPLAIGEIAFVIAVEALFRRAQRRGRLLAAFLLVIGIEFLLLPGIEALRFALYSPVTQGRLALHRALLRPAYLPLAAAGLALGAAAVVAAALLGRRRVPQ